MRLSATLRRGVTLVELLLSLVVTAIVGAALVKMVLSQARFMDQQEAWRNARSVARGGINRMMSDLRAVENGSDVAIGGVEAAAAGGQDFTVRVPYAFGIVCASAATTTTVSLLPVDSAMFNAPGFSGFAWRNSAGVYTYVPTTVAVALGGAANGVCNTAVPVAIQTLGSINGSPAGSTASLTTAAALAPVPPVGSIMFLYRRIRYEFKNSVIIPGRTALWRTAVTTGDTEELAGPFAATARVNFYVLNNAVAQAAVPANLWDIRGFELRLDGMSERTPAGAAAPKTANLTTSVFFENRPD